MESFCSLWSLIISILISTTLFVSLRKRDSRERSHLNHIHDLEEYTGILEDKLTEKQRQYDDLCSSSAASHAKYIQLERDFLLNEKQYELRCRRLEEENRKMIVKQRQPEITLVQPIALFMKRLVVMNKLWKQEKEISRLRKCLASRDQKIDNAAMEGFRDRLLLWNAVWKDQGKMRLLEEENARLKNSMARSITNAAKRMMLDTRREGMIEELMKELVTEIEDSRKEMSVLKERHELEVREINGNWIQSYQGLLREVEALRLGKRARDIEQELSNEMERRLLQTIADDRKPVSTSQALATKATKKELVVPKVVKKPVWR
ncbi:hypothetical protein AAF712_005957 [Marasmius tenuissimus]|uniref:Uncharacterized protein n=1 Tax=Marasmius tenuissimus TaxID=585030 RepID=A0ABR3A016_9AGAR